MTSHTVPHRILRSSTPLFAICTSVALSVACSDSNDDNKNKPGATSDASVDGAPPGSGGGAGAAGQDGGGGGARDGGGGGAAPADGGKEGGVTALVVKETDLVSNVSGKAPTTDPLLTNAWGLAPNTTAGVLWVAENHSGMVGAFDPKGGAAKLQVAVPGPDGKDAGAESAPTGQVFNASTTDFKADKFIVATEQGTIAGWQTAGQPLSIRVDQSADSGFKGLAIVENGTDSQIVAANFHKGTVDVFDTAYAAVASSSMYTDTGTPALPAGFVAFNVATLGGKVYVSYAKQDPQKADDEKGKGNGFVNVYEPDGSFVKRLVSGGDLNSPWAMELAPSSFGALAGTLLVGNFGDGKIHAYDPTTGALRGTLSTASGPLVIQGLWALVVGPKTTTDDFSQSVFFTAGPNDEADGLFGMLQVAQ